MRRRLAVFRDEESGRFAGKSSETSDWAKPLRDDFAASKVPSRVVREFADV